MKYKYENNFTEKGHELTIYDPYNQNQGIEKVGGRLPTTHSCINLPVRPPSQKVKSRQFNKHHRPIQIQNFLSKFQRTVYVMIQQVKFTNKRYKTVIW